MDDADVQKDQTRAVFDHIARMYDGGGAAVFAHFGRRLVEMAGVRPGERVLDVATGRGAVLFPAAEQVGATGEVVGEVVGTDLSAEMARSTDEEARRRGLPARALVMDAEQLDFPDGAFDHVLCGCGIMFFPQLQHALGEFRRVLKPGGQLAVTTWRVAQTDDLATVLTTLGLFAPGGYYRNYKEPAELAALLVAAGFGDVRVREATATFRYADLDQYWETAAGTWMWLRLNAPDTEQTRLARAALAERLEPHRHDDGIHRPVTALIGTARR
jgi:ubiquinone/menaquinone biosynthesis C-methylase UbiE